MPTRSAGRVSIRVVPDSTGFKRDLQKSLERIEKSMRVKIPAELELKREELARLKKQLEALAIKIKPTIDLRVTPEQIAEIKEKIEAMRPKVTVELSTAEASRRMAVLSRTRIIRLIPIVSKIPGLDGLGKKISGLAGLNVLTDMFRGGIEFFQNVDRNAVKLAQAYTKMAGIVGMATALVGTSSTLSAGLASIGNLAIFGPGFGVGFGIMVATAVVALKDMNDRLRDLGPQFTQLQDFMSDRFWRQAEAPIRRLVASHLPALKNMLGGTSDAMGRLFGEIADSFRQVASIRRIEGMFGRLNRAIEIGRGAIRPMTRALVTLGEHGSLYFERFSRWTVQLSEDFDKFIAKAAKDGRLKKWTDDAIANTKALGGIVASTVGVFAALNKAASAAGLPTLQDTDKALQRVVDTMNTPRFQQTLTTLFRGSKELVEGLGRGLRELGPAIESAAPSIERIMGTVGRIAEKVGTIVADIISDPGVQKAFEQFFLDIETSLGKLAPAVQPFNDSLAGALRLLGKILTSVSDLVAKFAIELMPEFDKIGLEFEKLIEPLNRSISNVITTLKPILSTFRTEVMAPLIPVAEDLLGILDSIVSFVGPTIEVALRELGKFIEGEVGPAIKELNGELKDGPEAGKSFAEGMQTAIDGITKFFNVIANPKEHLPGFNGNWLGGLFTGQADNFMKDWENFKRPINEWWNNTAWPGFESMLLDGLRGFESWTNNEFGPWAREAWAKFWDELIRVITLRPSKKGEEEGKRIIDEFWKGVGDNIKKAYEDFKRGFQEWIASLTPIDEMLEQIFGPKDKPLAGSGIGGRSVPAKIGPNFFNEEAEKTWFTTFFEGVNTKIAALAPSISAAITALGPIVLPVWTAFWDGLKAAPNLSLPAVTSTVGLNLGLIATSMGGFVTSNLPVWTSFFMGIQLRASQSFGQAATVVAARTIAMGGSISSFVAQGQPVLNAFLLSVATEFTRHFGTANRTTTTNMSSIAITVATKLASIKVNTSTGMAGVALTIAIAWTTIKGHFERGVETAVQIAGTMGSRVKGVVDSVDLSSSGAALVAGFAAGMQSNLGIVTSAALAVAAAVKAAMPHSPAKIGPLSGKGYTTHSGRALVEDLAGGMMDNMHKVRAATKAVAEAASVRSALESSADLDSDGVVIDRRQVTLINHNPVAEPTSRTIEKAANTFRMAKAM